MSRRERAQAFLAQGKTVRAAGLMLKLIEAEATPQNLMLLAEIYTEQGLFVAAGVLYKRAGLKGNC